MHTRFDDSPALPAKPVNGVASTEPPAKRRKVDSPNGSPKKADTDARQARVTQLAAIRQSLPIWAGRERIVQAVQDNDTVIILGETGCGKTTQVPQFLYEGNCPRKQPKIAITQPRRVAATSLAARVADEMGCKLGGKVGYTVRFDDCSNPKTTAIKYVTDGTLLQEMLSDRLLSAYDVIIVDEAHERTLRTDMILGFLKQILRERNLPQNQTKPDQPLSKLKVVVMSATLDAERFSEFFDKAPVLYVKGRSHKIQVDYVSAPQEDYIEATLKTIFQIHAKQPPGDILAFLTGEDEIEQLATQIGHYSKSLANRDVIDIHKLYAKLSAQMQAKTIFEQPKPGHRKVILATNIAETSVTIPGVKYVIDSGMMKEKTHSAVVMVDSLLVRPISQSSAEQRKGRAGREGPGRCLRLYEEATFMALPKSQTPEILRCNLEFAFLHLKAAGQGDVYDFDFMDRPSDEAIRTALIQLVSLGAIDPTGALTEDGRLMAGFPLTPAASRILLSSFQLGCPAEMTSLLALLDHADKLLSVPVNARESVATAREPFVHRSGDHLTLLRLLNHYERLMDEPNGRKTAQQWLQDVHITQRTMKNILEARKQLRERCERQKLDWKVEMTDEEQTAEKILRSCASGLATNTALLREDGKYKSAVSSMELKIHPSSVLVGKKPRVIIYSELTYTTNTYARTVSEIHPDYMLEHAPALWAR